MGVNTNDVARGFPVESLVESNERLLYRVAELEREVAHARHLAYHDALTGLPNRTLMLDRLQQAMLQATRQHKAVGLLLLDLDGFKRVNDELGHNAGDLILRQVAARLLSCIRVCDTACRYGGDEFIILLPKMHGATDLDTVTQKIRACLSRPHHVGDRRVAMRASIGAAVFEDGHPNCGELIRVADAAMYRAKARPGRATVESAGIAAPVAALGRAGGPESRSGAIFPERVAYAPCILFG